MCPLPCCIEERENVPSAKIQRTAEFKPNHLSLCDPLSFVAQRGGNLLHAIQTFSSQPNIVPPGAAVICKYFAIAIR